MNGGREDSAEGAGDSRSRGLAFVLLLLALALKIVYSFVFRIASDEAQHLHVVWGWTQGLVPYRDFFDNHTPVFHLLFAPVLWALLRTWGEHAEILVAMRLLMIPIYLASLWCTYRIGRALFSRTDGFWAAILVGLFPTFFLTSTEFRTDDLWALLWLAAILVLVNGRICPKRALIFGLILGATFGVSMKTSLLLGSLMLAALVTLVLLRLAGETFSAREITACVTAAILGTAVVPSAIVLFFASQGALAELYYCTIQHNVVPGMGTWDRFRVQQLIFPCAAPVLVLVARGLIHGAPESGIGARRAFVFLTALIQMTLMTSYWPMTRDQSTLPFLPLIFVFLPPVVALLVGRLRRPPGRERQPAAWGGFLACIGAIEIASVIVAWSPLRNEVGPLNHATNEILGLTNPDDYIMDAKGETLFRRRPFYYVLENVTQSRMKRGMLEDSIPERLIETRTPVVIWHRLPTRASEFVKANYVCVRPRLYVAGKMLDPAPPSDGRFVFEIQIPMRYRVVSEGGAVAGVLDGRPYEGTRFLEAGEHIFQRSSGGGRLAVLWARTVERGFLPF